MESNKFFKLTLPENPLTARMQSCRLRSRYTDVTIKIGEDEFEAHCSVIEDATPVLKAMLSENWSKNNGVLEFKKENIDPTIVEELLNFFYTGEILLTTDNVHPICTAAHFLHIPEILSACEKFISQNLQSSNVLDLFLFSDKLQLETLRKDCVNFLFKNHGEASKDSKIVDLSAEDLKVIMSEMEKEIENDNLKFKESLFEALIVWFEHDQAGRTSKFLGLLNSLPLHDLSLDFLARVVVVQKVISDSLPYSRLVMNAMNKVVSISGSGSLSEFKPEKPANKLICFGGQNSNGYLSSVSVLDIATGEWTNTTPMSSAEGYFGGAVIGNRIYLCGGSRGDSATRSDELKVFDFISNSWIKLQSMPRRLSSIGVAAVNEFIYASGGRDLSNSGASTVIRYCVKTNLWYPVKEMQTSRRTLQLTELKGMLYAIGGDGKNTVERYDPQTDEWTMVADTQYVHSRSGATSHKGKIYVHSSLGFEVYTPEMNTWKTLTAAHQYNGCTLVSIGDKLWSLGGGGTASVYEFDIVTEQWTQLPDMNEGRQYHCSFAVSC